MGLLGRMLRGGKHSPVTKKELHQLRMRAEKEEIKSRISKAHSSRWEARRKTWNSIAGEWGGHNSFNSFESRKKSRSFI